MKYLLEHTEWASRTDLSEFVDFCRQELGYSNEPRIELSDDLERAKELKSMGCFDPMSGSIWIFKGRRVTADWYRTLAHELVHHAQREMGKDLDGTDGSDTENEANSRAGEILRAWGKRNPSIFESHENDLDPADLIAGLVDMGFMSTNLSSTVWFIRRIEASGITPSRINIMELLEPTELKEIKSLESNGVVFYETYNYSKDKICVRMVAPVENYQESHDRIEGIIKGAVFRKFKVDDAAGLTRMGYAVAGWTERVWHDDPSRNRNWSTEQPEIAGHWFRKFGKNLKNDGGFSTWEPRRRSV